MSPEELLVAYYDRGDWTPETGARHFAATHWPQKRGVEDYRPVSPTACSFRVKNGVAAYVARHHERGIGIFRQEV